jgi:hypothetical protein
MMVEVIPPYCTSDESEYNSRPFTKPSTSSKRVIVPCTDISYMLSKISGTLPLDSLDF